MSISVKVFRFSAEQEELEFIDQVYNVSEIGIGRGKFNDVVLPEPDVSTRHVRVQILPDASGKDTIFLTDLGSANGTFIENDKVIPGESVSLGSRGRVIIGHFMVLLECVAEIAKPVVTNEQTGILIANYESESPTVQEPGVGSAEDYNDLSTMGTSTPVAESDAGEVSIVRTEADLSRGNAEPSSFPLRETLFEFLLDHPELSDVSEEPILTPELVAQATGLIDLTFGDDVLTALGGASAELVEMVISEVFGVGPFEQLFSDSAWSELRVEGHGKIYTDRNGAYELEPYCFSCEKALVLTLRRLLKSAGSELDQLGPLLEARLEDGSRLTAILPPVALQGPSVSVRRLSTMPRNMEHCVRSGLISAEMAAYLSVAVLERKNILLSGPHGSGKTSLLNALLGLVPLDEKVATIEDRTTLNVDRKNITSFETFPLSTRGEDSSAVSHLIEAVRLLRPDRIVLDESRGAEGLEFLEACSMDTPGSIVSVSAASPRLALSRLDTVGLSEGTVASTIKSSVSASDVIDVVVHFARFKCGDRRVVEISEVCWGAEGVELAEVFVFQNDGYSEEGLLSGSFVHLS